MLVLIFLLDRLEVRARDLLVLVGLPGMANWLLAAVGCGFFVAGPRKGNTFALAIALAVVATAHIVLVCILSFEGEKIAFGVRTGNSVNWQAMATQFNSLLFMTLFGHFRTLNLFAALLELAQFILLMLLLREYAWLGKDRNGRKHAMGMVILLPSALGILLVIYLLLKLLVENANLGRNGLYVGYILELLTDAVFIATFALSAVVVGGIKGSIYMNKK